MIKPKLLDFNEALAYLQKIGHTHLKAHSMRKEVMNFPHRFGAMRRNPLAKRGRGGKIYFTKDGLNKYTSLQEL